jgi:hypothetical protein
MSPLLEDDDIVMMGPLQGLVSCETRIRSKSSVILDR